MSKNRIECLTKIDRRKNRKKDQLMKSKRKKNQEKENPEYHNL